MNTALTTDWPRRRRDAKISDRNYMFDLDWTEQPNAPDDNCYSVDARQCGKFPNSQVWAVIIHYLFSAKGTGRGSSSEIIQHLRALFSLLTVIHVTPTSLSMPLSTTRYPPWVSYFSCCWNMPHLVHVRRNCPSIIWLSWLKRIFLLTQSSSLIMIREPPFQTPRKLFKTPICILATAVLLDAVVL